MGNVRRGEASRARIHGVKLWGFSWAGNTMPVPKIVHWEWKRTLPQFVAYMAILVLCYLIFPTMKLPHILVLGSGIYLAYSMSSKWLIPHHHRRGIRLLRQNHYQEAISAFEESLEFCTRHNWIDTYRAITLMTPTASSFREMALMNIAFSYGQLGDGEKLKAYCERVLKTWPNNEVAHNTLNLIEASRKISSQ